MDPAQAFAWHDHHFINGIACLDFANTVVYRPLPARREDRLETRANLRSWLAAAKPREGGALDLRSAIELREAIDTLFREIASGESLKRKTWEGFIGHYAQIVRHHAVKCTAEGLVLADGPADPLFAVAHSALTLALSPSHPQREEEMVHRFDVWKPRQGAPLLCPQSPTPRFP
jgi:predicted RNA-binding Zn ribbon-like protein